MNKAKSMLAQLREAMEESEQTLNAYANQKNAKRQKKAQRKQGFRDFFRN